MSTQEKELVKQETGSCSGGSCSTEKVSKPEDLKVEQKSTLEKGSCGSK